jgi:hypothetical protein
VATDTPPEYESFYSAPRPVCYGDYVFYMQPISDGGFGYGYFWKFHKTDGTKTRLDMSTADTFYPESSYREGNIWYLGATYYGNSDKYRHWLNLDTFTRGADNLGSSGSVYQASITANGGYYVISGSDVTLMNAVSATLKAQKKYTASKADGIFMIVPSLGRVIGTNGTYQDIPELMNY